MLDCVMEAMRLVPTHTEWKLASEIHKDFSHRDGAAHIAGKISLAHLSALLHSRP